MKYIAVDKTGNRIISYFADNKEEAKKAFEMLLRGRPGIDWYKKWVEDGKQVISE